MIHPLPGEERGGSGRPQRQLPGTVLGMDLMLRRLPAPVAVTTDANLPVVLATLTWEDYEAMVGRWAAEQVGLHWVVLL